LKKYRNKILLKRLFTQAPSAAFGASSIPEGAKGATLPSTKHADTSHFLTDHPDGEPPVGFFLVDPFHFAAFRQEMLLG
jgi:hypothetical protein